MKYLKYIVFSFILIGIFVSCNPQPEAEELLEHAKKFAENDISDSALLLIDSIFYPEKSFDKEEYMQYLVTRTQVRYKAYKDIKGDTAVFKAWKYYKEKKTESRWTALAAFYSGCVYLELDDKNRAMRAYIEALSDAKKTTDNKLKGLVQNNIGDMLSQQGLNRQALEAYKKAEIFYSEYTKLRLVSISNIGRSYTMIGNNDSAIVVFKNGLEQIRNNQKGKALLEQNLSISYLQEDKYQDALFYLKQAFKDNLDSLEIPRLYMNLANIYAGLGQEDSSRNYIELVKKSAESIKNMDLKISIYDALAQIEEANNDLRQTIIYLKKESEAYDKYLDIRNTNSILDIQQKYNFELLKNSYQEAVSKYQYGVIILLIIIILGIIAFSKYRIDQKNKLLETHERIATLSKMATELEHSSSTKMELQEQNMRELLMWKFDVIKKSILVTKMETDNAPTLQLARKFQEIVYHNKKGDVWTDIEEVINKIGKNLSLRLRARFPELSEKEYKICLLTYAGMNVKEIGVILELSSNSIQTYRTSLRKKLGILDIKTDTESFLKQTFGSN